MPRFNVTLIWTASRTYEVDAESAEAAAAAIEHQHGSPSLCHQCSHEVELGDLDRTDVYDENWKLIE